jgi:ABC-type branched-subunit amino acid transport system ATPase component
MKFALHFGNNTFPDPEGAHRLVRLAEAAGFDSVFAIEHVVFPETVAIIRAANAEGITTLVVEHDMEFVRELKSHVTVLHYGKAFADGSLAEIEANADVRQIYLGNRKRRQAARSTDATS